MQSTLQLNSAEDQSVNFVRPNGQECRFVRRVDDYFIIYVSSHNGCSQACRFCHLTQTKQTDFVPATLEEMADQVATVVDYYVDQVSRGLQVPAEKLHINWMARGEPLLNPVITKQWKVLATKLLQVVKERIATQDKAIVIPQVKFKISTIMPEEATLHVMSFDCLFNQKITPDIYYSLYSVNPLFRKRWIPNGMSPAKAVSMLKSFQDATHAKIALHWAFIEGENDSQSDCAEIVQLIKRNDLKAKFNAVRYNPYGEAQGKETSEENLQERFDQISRAMKTPGSRIVPRVGFDVSASCGCFVPRNVIPIHPVT